MTDGGALAEQLLVGKFYDAMKRKADKPQEFLLPVVSPTSSASEASEAEKPQEPVGPPTSFGPDFQPLNVLQQINRMGIRGIPRSLQAGEYCRGYPPRYTGPLPEGAFAIK